ncbi:MAG: hypothetical protein WC955_05630 [Elusimicrobiota bacterium]
MLNTLSKIRKRTTSKTKKRVKENMLNKDITYEQWKNLSWRQKQDLINNYFWPTMYHAGIDHNNNVIKGILNEFKEKIKGKSSMIRNIEMRWERTYFLEIFVTMKKGYKIRLPHKFDIFFIYKEYK